MSGQRSIVVTGGGTGGHIYPALAIADAAVARGVDKADIHYVGTQRGVDRQVVGPTGYAATYLDVAGLQRRITKRNIMVLPKLVRAVRAARKLFRQIRPAVVVNVGSYGSLPSSIAAKTMRIPLAVVVYDRKPGLAAKLMARGAALVAVAWKGSPLPGAQYTGAVIRPAILEMDRARDRLPARQARDLPADRFVVVVACGALGSKAINDSVAGLVEAWSDRGDIAIYHVVGDRFLAEAPPQRDGSAGIMYRVVGFEQDMAGAYAAADVMVCRAGSGTVAELIAAGIPSIVIPWPQAAENHQVDNANEMAAAGAAVVLLEPELSAERLGAEIDRLHGDPAALQALADGAYAAGATHRSGKLLDEILRIAGR